MAALFDFDAYLDSLLDTCDKHKLLEVLYTHLFDENSKCNEVSRVGGQTNRGPPILVFFGDGNNGKTTLRNLIAGAYVSKWGESSVGHLNLYEGIRLLSYERYYDGTRELTNQKGSVGDPPRFKRPLYKEGVIINNCLNLCETAHSAFQQSYEAVTWIHFKHTFHLNSSLYDKMREDNNIHRQFVEFLKVARQASNVRTKSARK